MKYERTISTDADESTICKRLATYFALAGYQQSISQPGLVAYRRGKFLSLTAKGCPANVVVQFTQTHDNMNQVKLTLEVDTTGQLVVSHEREYWDQQVEDMEKAIKVGEGK